MGSKNVDHHGLPMKKNFKITRDNALKQSPKKRNLDQKINYSKPHVWSLLILNFQLESLKASKN